MASTRIQLHTIVAAAGFLHAASLGAQIRPMTRAEAVSAALDGGTRLRVAQADTSLALADLMVAKARMNPALSLSYSRAFPNYHAIVELPLALPRGRRLRIRAAETEAQAALLRLQLAEANIALDADTTYTQAVASRTRVELARQNSADADSVLHMVERRHAAGTASEMELELARVNAGQMANTLMADSVEYISSLLDLQAILGVAGDGALIHPTDSLTMPDAAPVPGKTLNELAAEQSLESAAIETQRERRWMWPTPAIMFGFDWRDPDVPDVLPTIGIAIGLPLFDRNRGGIARADAEQALASAELNLARVAAQRQIAQATRERELALSRVRRDEPMVASAHRIAVLSLAAYREGTATVASVLGAQKNSRDILAKYIDDLADAWIATAELRVLATPPMGGRR